MPAIITNDQRDVVIELFSNNVPRKTIVKATGLSAPTIGRIEQMYMAVCENNLEWMSKYLSPSWRGSESLFVWACEKLGEDPNAMFDSIQTFAELRQSKAICNIAEEEPCKQNNEDAMPVDESRPQTTPFYIQQMLLNEAKIIELLTQLCDTVIPTHMKMLRADNEKNIDLVCERMKMETDAIIMTMADTNKYLDNIRFNTRSDKKPRPAYIIEKGSQSV